MKIGTFLVGLLLILAGSVLFLINLGYLPHAFARQLLDFWPLLLILIGISFFWGGMIPHWLALGLIIAMIGTVVALAFPL